jgi:hypothetical protein
MATVTAQQDHEDRSACRVVPIRHKVAAFDRKGKPTPMNMQS